MNRSTLAFLLGLSVLFNVFFIVGAMTWRTTETSADTSEVQQVAKILDLDDRQTKAFDSLRTQFRTEAVVLDQQLLRVRALIAEELASDTPDIQSLRQLTDQEASLQAERHAMGTDQFAHFIDLLSPDQRRLLGHRMLGPRHRHGPDGRPPEDIERRALEKFDLNGDGLLDEEERSTAREFAKQAHQQRRDRRRELEQQFDLDGDGKLSPEEREAFRQHMLEQRENRGDRPPPHDHRRGPGQDGQPAGGPPPQGP